MYATRTLPSGITMPALGFGTWHLTGDEGEEAILHALRTGYRHIDTADRYDNHTAVGSAVQRSGIPRGNIFLTSKVYREDLRYSDVVAVCERSLRELGTDYLDLFLIHWPNDNVPLEETLEAMHALKERGLIRAIGVSNFVPDRLEEALNTGIVIENNQVEYHPSLRQNAIKSYCDEHGIPVTAYSPLAQGKDIELPLIRKLAEKYDRSPAQIIINWLLSKGMATIPRAADSAYIEDNFTALDFSLAAEDVSAVDNLETNGNRVVHPEFPDFTPEATGVSSS